MKTAALTSVALLVPRLALACPVCFGVSDGPILQGSSMGILALLIVTLAMLGVFAAFIVTCIISDSVEGLGLDQVKDSPNLLVQWNYWYASNFDPLYQSHPVWLRFISGTSAFVYVAFYVLLILAIVRRWNWIQLPSVIYATMTIALTGIPIFGVEFFGSAAERTPNPGVFLAFNLPYIVFPLLLLLRMRKPLPFTRRF